jgi:hypothetical protein
LLLPFHNASGQRPSVTAVRLAQNPLITVDSSPTLGDNVNGPSVIRVPAWLQHPLGRYYAYFGHHKASSSGSPMPTRSRARGRFTSRA